MIYSIKGILIEKQKDCIIVETNGIAYEIIFLTSAYDRLPDIGCEVSVFTQFLVREDGYLLFGFLSCEDKKFFNTLMSVPSLGPKTAYNVMNSIPITRLVEAILKEDEKCLTQVSGIGSKTAKRIILELKDKIAKLSSSAKDGMSFGSGQNTGTGAHSALVEARLALSALGFGYSEVDRMIGAIVKENGVLSLSTEEIIKLALKRR